MVIRIWQLEGNLNKDENNIFDRKMYFYWKRVDFKTTQNAPKFANQL